MPVLNRWLTCSCWLLLWLLVGESSPTNGTEQSADDYVEHMLGCKAPAVSFIWLKGEVADAVKKILGHDYPQQRVRYWSAEGRTVWVLEEIGKVKLITVGFVVANSEITQMKVLVYRESRGREIANSFFTDRFKGQKLDAKLQLQRPVDGISGATLSVRAMTRLARMALCLDAARHPVPNAAAGPT